MGDRKTAAPSQWMVQTKRADFSGIAQKYGISPVTARIIRNRGVVEDEDIRKYLSGTLEDMYSPWLLPDMDKAAAIIKQKAEEKASIRVVGDYDIDGVCSTIFFLPL